jgi:hypothetical protein
MAAAVGAVAAIAALAAALLAVVYVLFAVGAVGGGPVGVVVVVVLRVAEEGVCGRRGRGRRSAGVHGRAGGGRQLRVDKHQWLARGSARKLCGWHGGHDISQAESSPQERQDKWLHTACALKRLG